MPPELDLFKDVDLLITRDSDGFDDSVFLIRICQWSLDLLTDAVALPRFKPETELPHLERDALRLMFNTDSRQANRFYVPRHWFNVYDDHEASRSNATWDGTMLVNSRGVDKESGESMNRWLDRVEQHPQQLRIPVENTTYTAEIDVYYTGLRKALHLLQEAGKLRDHITQEREDLIAYDKRLFENLQSAEAQMREFSKEEAFDSGKMEEGIKKLNEELDTARQRVEASDMNLRESIIQQARAEVEAELEKLQAELEQSKSDAARQGTESYEQEQKAKLAEQEKSRKQAEEAASREHSQKQKQHQQQQEEQEEKEREQALEQEQEQGAGTEESSTTISDTQKATNKLLSPPSNDSPTPPTVEASSPSISESPGNTQPQTSKASTKVGFTYSEKSAA